jgi:RNA polymerase sigma-70 factor, ECF subfamily
MQATINPETEIIERARQGDRQAFESLVKAHSSYVFNLAFHLTAGNHSEADDLAQMTFIRAFRAIRRFEGRSELRTWLHRITVNLWKNMVRSQVRRKYFQHRSLSEPIGEDERGLTHEIPEKGPDPLTQTERSELDRLIRDAVDRLPPDEREVMVLRDLEGHAYEEIAKLTRLPLGTVKSRIARARRMLRATLEPLLRR